MEVERANNAIMGQGALDEANNRVVELTAENARLYKMLDAAIEDKPMDDGQYVHAIYCNSNGKYPPGTKGVTCNCPVRKRFATLEAENAKLREELVTVNNQLLAMHESLRLRT